MTDFLQGSGVFVVGMAARLALVLLGVAAVVAPALVIAAGLRGWEARRARRLGIREVSGVPFRPDVAYAPGHVWLRRRGPDALELGLDGLAQQLLPAATSVVPVHPGTRVRKGEVLAVVRSGERELPLLAPAAGTVLGVNPAAVRAPSLVKREGCGRGWLVLFAPADASLAALPTGAAAEAWLRREAERFARFLEERLGFAAADGGALVAPAPWLLGDAGYRELCDAVLRPEA
jgi:glycine cleavage system H lipoate-binding protein